MSAQDMFWAAPPVTRTLTAASVLISAGAHLLGTPSFSYIFFEPSQIFRLNGLPEVWRLVTSFLITGPGISMLMDPYFLYTYGSQLELSASRFSSPGDFLVYVVFVGAVILLTGGWYLGGYMFLSALTVAFTYTHAQEDPNRQVSFFIVTFAMKYLPYVMILMTLVQAPGAAMVQATGIVAAHAYEFLFRIWPQHGGGTNLISTPAFVQQWFAAPVGTGRDRGAGTAFAPRPAGVQAQQAAQTGNTGGWTSGFGGGGGGTWNQRGQGRRLGGE